jgi:hypothetical protein
MCCQLVGSLAGELAGFGDDFPVDVISRHGGICAEVVLVVQDSQALGQRQAVPEMLVDRRRPAHAGSAARPGCRDRLSRPAIRASQAHVTTACGVLLSGASLRGTDSPASRSNLLMRSDRCGIATRMCTRGLGTNIHVMRAWPRKVGTRLSGYVCLVDPGDELAGRVPPRPAHERFAEHGQPEADEARSQRVPWASRPDQGRGESCFRQDAAIVQHGWEDYRQFPPVPRQGAPDGRLFRAWGKNHVYLCRWRGGR